MDYKKTADALISHLEKRGFEAYYCDNAAAACEKAISLIDKDDTVSWGGSRTVDQLDLVEQLRKEGYKLIDRATAETPEERTELMRQSLLCDTFLMSANAISSDGILVNIDGTGNRVAAMCFGPKSVLVIAGMNKVCDTLEDAEYRARNVAAPANVKRFGFTKTGCQKGKCTDCLAENCICSYIVKTRKSNVKNRIKIILVGEELGF